MTHVIIFWPSDIDISIVLLWSHLEPKKSLRAKEACSIPHSMWTHCPHSNILNLLYSIHFVSQLCLTHADPSWKVHLPYKGEIAFSAVDFTGWSGSCHDSINFPRYPGLSPYLLQSIGTSYSMASAEKSGAETASALWNICQTTHSNPWYRAHGHLLQRHRCLSLKLRRHFLATAISSCSYLKLTCLMDYSKRCTHTQARHNYGSHKIFLVKPQKVAEESSLPCHHQIGRQ